MITVIALFLALLGIGAVSAADVHRIVQADPPSILDFAEQVKEAESQKRRSGAFDSMLVKLFVLLAATWGALRFAALRTKSRPVAKASLWAVAGIALLAAAYILAGVYVDVQLGSSLAYSRSGVRLSADTSSVLFWVIVAGKLIVALLIVVVGIKSLKDIDRN